MTEAKVIPNEEYNRLHGLNGTPQPEQRKCPHLGLPVMDATGTPLKRTCEPCGGKQRQIFDCKHPAREPDQVTQEDCWTCGYRPKPDTKATPIILRNFLSPGDVLCMTAAIHSLHKHHPGKFLTAVTTSCDAVFENNPDVVPLGHAQYLGAKEIEMNPKDNPTNLINQSNQLAVHVLQRDCHHLEKTLGVPVPLATNRPHVFVSNREKTWMNQVEEITHRKMKFWLVNAGVKTCYTAKQYPWFQEVVDRLQGKVVFAQIGKLEHVHTPLRGVINLLGKTDDRQLIRLCYHASGVLCGVTYLMHLAAAFEKPAVIVAGGREPRLWNQYPMQVLLSTVGMLPCCQSACWKSRTIPLRDGDAKDESLCESPTLTEPASPKCMAMISPETVCNSIESYYNGGAL